MFSMDLDSGESGGYVVVALRGELDLVDAAAVAAALGAVAAREPRIIVDLAGLEFIDASGVGALARGRRRARNAGGDLLLAAPQRRYGWFSRSSGRLAALAFLPAWQRQPPVWEPLGKLPCRSSGSPLRCAGSAWP